MLQTAVLPYETDAARCPISKIIISLHCALCLAAQCIVIGPVCVFACLQRAGGRAVSEPYYSRHARAVFVSLSAFFIGS